MAIYCATYDIVEIKYNFGWQSLGQRISYKLVFGTCPDVAHQLKRSSYSEGSDSDESHENDQQGSNLGACGSALPKVPAT